jgi:hypothetical protein
MNKKDLNATAQKIATSANKKAQASTGWKKWLYAAAAILAAAVAFFTASGCTATYSQTAAGDISANVTIVQPAEFQK